MSDNASLSVVARALVTPARRLIDFQKSKEHEQVNGCSQYHGPNGNSANETKTVQERYSVNHGSDKKPFSLNFFLPHGVLPECLFASRSMMHG